MSGPGFRLEFISQSQKTSATTLRYKVCMRSKSYALSRLMIVNILVRSRRLVLIRVHTCMTSLCVCGTRATGGWWGIVTT